MHLYGYRLGRGTLIYWLADIAFQTGSRRGVSANGPAAGGLIDESVGVAC